MRPRKYPWLELNVGEAFFVPNKPSNYVMGLARRYRPRRFKSMRVSVKGVTGTKIWRTA